jgi:endonuclease G, mitochondrial
MDDSPGFDAGFLGAHAPLPVPPPGRSVRELRSTHFTVLLDTVRRLAAATGVNIDGESLRDVPRGDDWHLDPRVAAHEQAGDELYSRNDLDRGHLVRRRDPVWGDDATARRANRETFAFPNAAPQVARFNQSPDLWVGLEDHVLEHARAYGRRLSVLTGPVLAPGDPVYRGIQVPCLFWKVAVWSSRGPAGVTLSSTAFVLDQTEMLTADVLDDTDARVHGDWLEHPAPALGAFRSFQVPVAEVARLSGLDLGPVVAADVLASTAPQRAPGRSSWTLLVSAEDVVL